MTNEALELRHRALLLILTYDGARQQLDARLDSVFLNLLC
jgi:hypothetical protein